MTTIQIDIQQGSWIADRQKYPLIGFGTYRLTGKTCFEAINHAIQAGYPLIDTATFYENFESIAKAIKEKQREKLYLVSKVWHDQQTAELLKQDFDQTLKQLAIDYLDAYLLHWPNSKIPIEETLGAMDALFRSGKLRTIGLSNVTVNHLTRALEVGVPISWVQVEMHPFFYDRQLMQFCQEKGLAIQAWRPLNMGQVMGDALLNQIGRNHGKTAAQVALRWIVQHGSIPLPSSKSEQHIRENFAIFDFNLSEIEMGQIDQRAAKGIRYRMRTERGLGFKDEFDFTYEQYWPKKD